MKEPIILKDLIEYDFLLKIVSSFQDFDNLYLVTNYFEGDVLYNYKDQEITEKEIQFISACIIQSLVYLREKTIINRDVRMKNLIMDKQGYLNLIDFSFSIKYKEKNDHKNDITGNKIESSPEILNHSVYDYNSDYYRIGTILYYLIFKKYVNAVKIENNKNEIAIDYKANTNFSTACLDFINKLIITDYKKRLGFKSINELKNHNWFNGFDWQKFNSKALKSPLKFMKKKFNKTICKKFIIKTKIHQKFNDKKIYKLIKNYEYVNKIIVEEILNFII